MHGAGQSSDYVDEPITSWDRCAIARNRVEMGARRQRLMQQVARGQFAVHPAVEVARLSPLVLNGKVVSRLAGRGTWARSRSCRGLPWLRTLPPPFVRVEVVDPLRLELERRKAGKENLQSVSRCVSIRTSKHSDSPAFITVITIPVGPMDIYDHEKITGGQLTRSGL